MGNNLQKISLKNITSFKSYSTLSKLILFYFLPPISDRCPKQKKMLRVKVVPLDVPEFFETFLKSPCIHVEFLKKLSPLHQNFKFKNSGVGTAFSEL